MLTTGTRSRTRLALGGTAVAALMIVGLAGTASGTAAAASVRAGVEKATGIDIAKFDAKPQSMPPAAPAMPEGAEVPAPPAPPEAAAPPARVKKIKIVKIDKDGNTISENVTDIPDMPDMPELADMPELKNIPDVRSGDCKGGGDATVINKQKGDRRIMMICTNRIQRMASLAADRAMRAKDIQRMSYDRALEGLRRARESMMRNDNLTGEGRRDALDGIDEAIRDMEAERAERD